MTSIDLWSVLARDVDAEHRDAILASASTEASEVWKFVTAADSQPDFENRLALSEDQLHRVASVIATEGTPDYMLVVGTLPQQWFSDWQHLHSQRQAAVQAANAPRAAARAAQRKRADTVKYWIKGAEGGQLVAGPFDTEAEAEAVYYAEWADKTDDMYDVVGPGATIATKKTAVAGQFKIEEYTGSYSGQQRFTLLYMGPEDSFGYGVWEPVKDFDTREAAEAFIANPEPWFGTSASKRAELGEPKTGSCPKCGSGKYAPELGVCTQCGFHSKNATKQAAGSPNPYDRSAAFSVLLDVWPGFGDSPDDGGKSITDFLNAFYADPSTDMYAFAQQWVQGKTASRIAANNGYMFDESEGYAVGVNLPSQDEAGVRSVLEQNPLFAGSDGWVKLQNGSVYLFHRTDAGGGTPTFDLTFNANGAEVTDGVATYTDTGHRMSTRRTAIGVGSEVEIIGGFENGLKGTVVADDNGRYTVSVTGNEMPTSSGGMQAPKTADIPGLDASRLIELSDAPALDNDADGYGRTSARKTAVDSADCDHSKLDKVGDEWICKDCGALMNVPDQGEPTVKQTNAKRTAGYTWHPRTDGPPHNHPHPMGWGEVIGPNGEMNNEDLTWEEAQAKYPGIVKTDDDIPVTIDAAKRTAGLFADVNLPGVGMTHLEGPYEVIEDGGQTLVYALVDGLSTCVCAGPADYCQGFMDANPMVNPDAGVQEQLFANRRHPTATTGHGWTGQPVTTRDEPVVVSTHPWLASLAPRTAATDRDRAMEPELGDQSACKLCGADIAYDGDWDWRDRGGNIYCDESGHHPVDENGVSGDYPHVKHWPTSDHLAQLLTRAASRRKQATADDSNYSPCPNHPGQWFDKSTGMCSCGGNHNPGENHTLEEAGGHWLSSRRTAGTIEDAILEHAKAEGGTLSVGDRVGDATITDVGTQTIQFDRDDGYHGSVQIPWFAGGDTTKPYPSYQRALDEATGARRRGSRPMPAWLATVAAAGEEGDRGATDYQQQRKMKQDYKTCPDCNGAGCDKCNGFGQVKKSSRRTAAPMGEMVSTCAKCGKECRRYVESDGTPRVGLGWYHSGDAHNDHDAVPSGKPTMAARTVADVQLYRDSLIGTMGVDPEVLAQVPDSELPALFESIMHEQEIPPSYWDTGLDRGRVLKNRARDLVINHVLDKRSARTAADDKDNSFPPKQPNETNGPPDATQAPGAAPGVPQAPQDPTIDVGQVQVGDAILEAADGRVNTFVVNNATPSPDGQTITLEVTKNGTEDMTLAVPLTERVQAHPGADASAAPKTDENAPADPNAPAPDPNDPNAPPAGDPTDPNDPAHPDHPDHDKGSVPADDKAAAPDTDGDGKAPPVDKDGDGKTKAPTDKPDDDDDDDKKKSKPPWLNKGSSVQMGKGSVTFTPEQVQALLRRQADDGDSGFPQLRADGNDYDIGYAAGLSDGKDGTDATAMDMSSEPAAWQRGYWDGYQAGQQKPSQRTDV
jgi:RNase P subunit RPR2